MKGDHAHTEIDLLNGGIRPATSFSRRIVIEPDFDLPKKDLRYQVTSWTLGRLEKLAKSRLEISKMTSENLTHWKRRDEGVIVGIAQSVRASSEIEGEVVYVEKAEIPPFPTTTKEESLGVSDDEIQRRRLAGEDIYDAYIWALNHEAHQLLSEDFLLELHRRMFSRAYPFNAGKWKTEEIVIKGEPYHVTTVTPKRARQYMRNMSARLLHQWEQAHRGRYNHFLLAGEFVLDFLAIHPFEDGNGRFARLLSTFLLEKAGYHFPRFYPLDSVIRDRRSEYYENLFNAQKGWMTSSEDLTPWMNFYIACVEIQCARTMEYLHNKSLEEGVFQLKPVEEK